MRPAPAGPAGSKTQREVRTGPCGQGLVPDDFPVPGQEFVHMGFASSGMRQARPGIGEQETE